MYRSGLVIGFILLLVGSSIHPVAAQDVGTRSHQMPSGDWLYVGGLGPGNYTRIQDAINASSPGDTVFVYHGAYVGQVSVNKSITLIGEDKNTTYLIGYFADTLALISDGVNLSGFTIQYIEGRGEGVKIDSNHNRFFNNIIDMPRERIRLFGDSNTFSGNIITGAYLHCIGDHNNISYNTITNTPYGLYLTETCGNIIVNNSFFLSGLFIADDFTWDNHVRNNTVNGKPLVYVEDVCDLVLVVDAGQVILVNCSNIHVEHQAIANTTVGIQLQASTACVLSNNSLVGNHFGICLDGWENTITGNTMTWNYYGIFLSGDRNIISANTITHNAGNGIYLSYSDQNVILNNSITQNLYGIMLDYGCDVNSIRTNTIMQSTTAIRLSGDTNTTLSRNTIVDSSDGVLLVSCQDTTILQNTLRNNSYGIRLEDSAGSIISHNDLLDNEHNAFDSFKNTWDDGKRCEGNYWSDYPGYDTNGDGIGDTPYDIPGGTNRDLYPLMEPSAQYYTLHISVDDLEVFEATTFSVTIYTLRGKRVSNAEVCFNETTLLTDSNGTTWFTAPMVEGNITYELAASKSGYLGTTTNIVVKNAQRIGAFLIGRITNRSSQGHYLKVEAVKIRLITFTPWRFYTYDSYETITLSRTKLGFIGEHYIFAVCTILV